MAHTTSAMLMRCGQTDPDVGAVADMNQLELQSHIDAAAALASARRGRDSGDFSPEDSPRMVNTGRSVANTARQSAAVLESHWSRLQQLGVPRVAASGFDTDRSEWERGGDGSYSGRRSARAPHVTLEALVADLDSSRSTSARSPLSPERSKTGHSKNVQRLLDERHTDYGSPLSGRTPRSFRLDPSPLHSSSGYDSTRSRARVSASLGSTDFDKSMDAAPLKRTSSDGRSSDSLAAQQRRRSEMLSSDLDTDRTDDDRGYADKTASLVILLEEDKTAPKAKSRNRQAPLNFARLNRLADHKGQTFANEVVGPELDSVDLDSQADSGPLRLLHAHRRAQRSGYRREAFLSDRVAKPMTDTGASNASKARAKGASSSSGSTSQKETDESEDDSDTDEEDKEAEPSAEPLAKSQPGSFFQHLSVGLANVTVKKKDEKREEKNVAVTEQRSSKQDASADTAAVGTSASPSEAEVDVDEVMAAVQDMLKPKQTEPHADGSDQEEKHLCDADGCSNIGTKRCAACEQTRYCSRECQVADWNTHWVVCVPPSQRSRHEARLQDEQRRAHARAQAQAGIIEREERAREERAIEEEEQKQREREQRRLDDELRKQKALEAEERKQRSVEQMRRDEKLRKQRMQAESLLQVLQGTSAGKDDSKSDRTNVLELAWSKAAPRKAQGSEKRSSSVISGRFHKRSDSRDGAGSKAVPRKAQGSEKRSSSVISRRFRKRNDSDDSAGGAASKAAPRKAQGSEKRSSSVMSRRLHKRDDSSDSAGGGVDVAWSAQNCSQRSSSVQPHRVQRSGPSNGEVAGPIKEAVQNSAARSVSIQPHRTQRNRPVTANPIGAKHRLLVKKADIMRPLSAARRTSQTQATEALSRNVSGKRSLNGLHPAKQTKHVTTTGARPKVVRSNSGLLKRKAKTSKEL